MSEIPKREWPQFLERLVREHRGWLATVEQDGRIAAREQPLLGIRANGSIDIHVGEGTVRIDAPCAVDWRSKARRAAACGCAFASPSRPGSSTASRPPSASRFEPRVLGHRRMVP